MRRANIIALSAWLLLVGQRSYAQDLYRTTRSLEVQQAISHVAQASYYVRMALRSLEASEKTARAPFFDYRKAREDLERISNEFKVYLHGDGSPVRAAAIPVVIDGRYFSESIRAVLMTGSLPAEEPRAAVQEKQKPAENLPVEPKASGPEPEPEKSSAQVEPLSAAPPEDQPGKEERSSEKTKRAKIEEILKKGL